MKGAISITMTKMTVSELIKELGKQNPQATISVLTIQNGQSTYTSNPKVSSHKNRFGETVWIQ